MVSIFTGLGSGFERGSLAQLGAAGLLGSGTLGRSGEQLSVNAATGNFLISQRDEFLVGVGPDSAIARTYNSLGNFSDENGDNWRQSTDRRVHGLTGTLNTAGSTISRTSGDGSDRLLVAEARATPTIRPFQGSPVPQRLTHRLELTPPRRSRRQSATVFPILWSLRSEISTVLTVWRRTV